MFSFFLCVHPHSQATRDCFGLIWGCVVFFHQKSTTYLLTNNNVHIKTRGKQSKKVSNIDVTVSVVLLFVLFCWLLLSSSSLSLFFGVRSARRSGRLVIMFGLGEQPRERGRLRTVRTCSSN